MMYSCSGSMPRYSYVQGSIVRAFVLHCIPIPSAHAARKMFCTAQKEPDAASIVPVSNRP
jgi:hypothetical protein